jgi:hypothetical protein
LKEVRISVYAILPFCIYAEVGISVCLVYLIAVLGIYIKSPFISDEKSVFSSSFLEAVKHVFMELIVVTPAGRRHSVIDISGQLMVTMRISRHLH